MLPVCFRAKKPTRNNHVKNVRLINEAIIRKSRRVTSRCPHVTLQHGDTNKGCSASVGADKCLPQTRVNIFGRMPLIIILGVDYAPRAIKTKQTEAPGVAEGTSHVGLDRNGDWLEAVIYSAVSRKPLKINRRISGSEKSQKRKP